MVDSLFNRATDVPANFAADAPGWTLGTRMSADDDREILRGWWYVPTGTTGTLRFRAYDADTPGLLTGTDVDFVSYTPGAWSSSPDFAAPVSVTGLGHFHACVVTTASGHYGFTGGLYPITTGHLSADLGVFLASDGYPPNGSSACYFVDVDSQAVGGGMEQALGAIAELETLAATGRIKTRPLGEVLEQSSLVAPGRAKVRALAAVADSESLTEAGRTKVRALAGVVALETLAGLGMAKRWSLGPLVEGEALATLGAQRRYSLGPLVEAEALAALGRLRRRGLATIAELETLASLGGAAPARPGRLTARGSSSKLVSRTTANGLTARRRVDGLTASLDG